MPQQKKKKTREMTTSRVRPRRFEKPISVPFSVERDSARLIRERTYSPEPFYRRPLLSRVVAHCVNTCVRRFVTRAPVLSLSYTSVFVSDADAFLIAAASSTPKPSLISGGFHEEFRRPDGPRLVAPVRTRSERRERFFFRVFTATALRAF